VIADQPVVVQRGLVHQRYEAARHVATVDEDDRLAGALNLVLDVAHPLAR
jgi:hypothetical protein